MKVILARLSRPRHRTGGISAARRRPSTGATKLLWKVEDRPVQRGWAPGFNAVAQIDDHTGQIIEYGLFVAVAATNLRS